MPSLGFSIQFVPRVESGEKLHSIRGRRKHPQQWMPGKTVHLFYAMRTKHCRRLGEGEITSLHDIEIDETGVEIDGSCVVDPIDLLAFARADGFDSWVEFVSFFRSHYGLPWSGSLIKWRLRKPGVRARLNRRKTSSPTAQEGKAS